MNVFNIVDGLSWSGLSTIDSVFKADLFFGCSKDRKLMLCLSFRLLLICILFVLETLVWYFVLKEVHKLSIRAE